MENQFFDKQIKGIVVCFFTYALVSIPVILLTQNFLHLMMVWNLFLAILPLIFAKLLQKYDNPNKSKTIVLSLLWLFFFPNSPYMITDFIHISGVKFYSSVNKYSPTLYTTNIISWIKIVHIGIGIFLGTIAGMLSLYIIHQLLLKQKGKVVANGVILITCLLSGYAVYIGRFLRFNTWDILRPTWLISQLIRNTNLFSFSFSMLFALYVLATYGIFYAFYNNKH